MKLPKMPPKSTKLSTINHFQCCRLMSKAAAKSDKEKDLDSTVKQKRELLKLYPFDNPDKTILKLSKGNDANNVEFGIHFKRNYALPLPSVSKIIQKTMPEQQRMWLERWEKAQIAKLGIEGFKAMKKQMFAHGNELHGAVEDYFRGILHFYLL